MNAIERLIDGASGLVAIAERGLVVPSSSTELDLSIHYQDALDRWRRAVKSVLSAEASSAGGES